MANLGNIQPIPWVITQLGTVDERKKCLILRRKKEKKEKRVSGVTQYSPWGEVVEC
jgi:hypothetical protein